MSTHIEERRYHALTHQLSLKSKLARLTSALRMGYAPDEQLLESLDDIQKDVQGIGYYFDSHKALLQHRHLTLDLASLAAAVRMRNISIPELERCLKLSEADALGLDEFFSDQLPPIYWNVRRAEDSTVARTVFGIPEILENILTSCHVVDVLSILQTCSGICDIIEASSKIKAHLCLIPAAAGTPRYFPFTEYNTPGFSCQLSTERHQDDSPRVVATITVEMDPDGVYWPSIGRCMRDMFICQPPIYNALVTEYCPMDDSDIYALDLPIQMGSDMGLTIGDLYDVAEVFIDNHKTCRDPMTYDYRGMEPHRARFTVEFKECLTQQEWDDAAAATASHDEYVSKRLQKEGRSPDQGLRVRSKYEDYGSEDEYDGPTDGDEEEDYQGSDDGYGTSCENGNRGDEGAYDHENEAVEEAERRLASVVYHGYGDA